MKEKYSKNYSLLNKLEIYNYIYNDIFTFEELKIIYNQLNEINLHIEECETVLFHLKPYLYKYNIIVN